MSRLDSFIRRVTAQRACLNLAAQLVTNMPGPVLEFGLGNGRTYDHLREILPDREIFVFDKRVAAHPDCIPDEDHMLLGDFRETLPRAVARIGQRAVLAHCDTGSGDRAATAALAQWLGPALRPLLVPGALVVSDQPLDIPGAEPLPLPDGVAVGRYHLYRLAGEGVSGAGV